MGDGQPVADCLFCKIVAGEIPATVVRETASTPWRSRTCSRRPRRTTWSSRGAHYANAAELAAEAPELAAALLAEGGEVAKAEGLAADGYRLVFNTGSHAGADGVPCPPARAGRRPSGQLSGRPEGWVAEPDAGRAAMAFRLDMSVGRACLGFNSGGRCGEVPAAFKSVPGPPFQSEAPSGGAAGGRLSQLVLDRPPIPGGRTLSPWCPAPRPRS